MILSTLFLAGAFFCFGVAARDLCRLYADWRASSANLPELSEGDLALHRWSRTVRKTGWAK